MPDLSGAIDATRVYSIWRGSKWPNQDKIRTLSTSTIIFISKLIIFQDHPLIEGKINICIVN